ncbi:hypothetical protein SC81_22995, partial [Vibrio vulnificus]
VLVGGQVAVVVAFAGEQALVIVGEGGIAAGAVGRGLPFDGDDVFATADHLEAVGVFFYVCGDHGGSRFFLPGGSPL